MNAPTKPYELTFDERPHYLYARINADKTDVATAIDYWQAMIHKCRELALKRLLVEQIIPGGLSTTDTFNLASAVTAMAIYDIKIAFVDPDTKLYEAHQFGELVGNNRGAWAKVFTTIAEAENWLLRDLES